MYTRLSTDDRSPCMEPITGLFVAGKQRSRERNVRLQGKIVTGNSDPW